MNRNEIEQAGRTGAKVIDSTNDYLYVRVLDMFNMYAMSNDVSVTPHLALDGFWESWVTKWFIDNVTAGTVVYDVGANSGYYSFLSLALGAIVTAFEPNPPYYRMLKATSERNRTSRFRLSDKALSDTDGVATLHVPARLHGSASLSPMDEKWLYHEVTVETRRFDTYMQCFGAGKQIIKIDAEGAEEKIWDGMVSLLENHVGMKPIVLMEYTPGAYSDEFLDKLEKYAPLRWVNHSGSEEPVSKEWILSQTDWVMLVLRRDR